MFPASLTAPVTATALTHIDTPDVAAQPPSFEARLTQLQNDWVGTLNRVQARPDRGLLGMLEYLHTGSDAGFQAALTLPREPATSICKLFKDGPVQRGVPLRLKLGVDANGSLSPNPYFRDGAEGLGGAHLSMVPRPPDAPAPARGSTRGAARGAAQGGQGFPHSGDLLKRIIQAHIDSLQPGQAMLLHSPFQSKGLIWNNAQGEKGVVFYGEHGFEMDTRPHRVTQFIHAMTSVSPRGDWFMVMPGDAGER